MALTIEETCGSKAATQSQQVASEASKKVDSQATVMNGNMKDNEQAKDVHVPHVANLDQKNKDVDDPSQVDRGPTTDIMLTEM
ncbi:quinol:cytochrome C oxidoreductase [Sesbania bispinosa]|nr:quinol:cytochrome C oxidoreductase [Sesbania bispinosa]